MYNFTLKILAYLNLCKPYVLALKWQLSGTDEPQMNSGHWWSMNKTHPKLFYGSTEGAVLIILAHPCGQIDLDKREGLLMDGIKHMQAYFIAYHLVPSYEM